MRTIYRFIHRQGMHSLPYLTYTQVLINRVVPAGIAGIQKPWMAMPKQTTSLVKEELVR
jgi:hypothetical protein